MKKRNNSGTGKKSVGSSRHETKAEPHVGIFWLVDGKLIFDSTSISQAEPYGDHLTHPRSHIDVWTRLQQSGKVPQESEYEEFPRGRVMLHSASSEFAILADRCILKRKDLISQIKRALHLPKKVKLGSDSHYRCHVCLHGQNTEDD